MKTKNTLGLMALTAAVVASVNVTYAETLTPEQALARVNGTSGIPARVKAPGRNVTPQLMFTQTNDGAPTVYLFNDEAGFMLVSANDVAPAVLGYGENLSQINPELKWWMQEYGRQIQWASDAGMPSALSAEATTADYAPIAPMTTTRWNQSAPFNDDCPEINGTRCVTGCVATALSQVMKYHNWPATGTGSNTYTPSSVGKSLTVDFGTTTYDWDDMINVYGSDATSAQKAAVANLMYSAGVAVNMDYTTDESSATSFAAAQAMVNYFNYDKGIVYYSRDYYTIDDWNALVYNQLKTYGPVQYSGQSNDGGHSFVCDGYSSDGYFHINWGWGGMSDGYFLLTALNPTSQGIGGSTSGYNFDQDIIGNVKPADGSASTIVPNFAAQQFAVNSSSASLGSQVYFAGPVYSFSLANVSGNYGLKITDASGNVTYAKGSAYSNLQPEYGVNGYYVTIPSSLASGTYSIAPAVCSSEGNWYDIPVLVGSEQTKSMTVSGGTATFSTVGASTISVDDISVNSAFYIGSDYELTVTVTNNGSQEYLGGIRLMLINSNEQAVAEGDEYPVDLSAGESTDITYVSSWAAASGTTLSAGSYYICFVDANGNQLSDMQAVTLNAAATPTLGVSNFVVSGDANNVDASELEFTASISCESGYFGGSLSLVIFPYTSGNVTSVASYSTDPVFISSGQTANLDIKANFNNATPGATYFAMLYNGSNYVSTDQVVFKVSNKTTGTIDTVGDTVYPTDTKYYTIDGMSVPASVAESTPGLYIARQTMSDGTVNTQKTVMR